MIPGVSKAWPRITLAVFLPTPASRVSSSIVAGTSPPNSSTNCRAHSFNDLALARKSPRLRMICSMSALEAWARVVGIGITTEKFRRDSVHRLIRALGREDDCDQQLKGISIMERNL